MRAVLLRCCIVFLSLYIGFSGLLYAEQNKPTLNADTLFAALKKALPNHAEFSAAIIKHGKVCFMGFRREGKDWLPVDNSQSVFEIGSITKVFTSTLLAHAVQNGIVRLDDPISFVSPVVINGAKKDSKFVTLVSLANHTSGLPRLPPRLMRSMLTNGLIASSIWPYFKKNGNPYYGYNERKFDKYLSKGVKLKTVPGTALSYSNLGAALLGHLLVKKQHSDYETLLREQIFVPFGMASSTTHRENVSTRLVRGRSNAGRKAKNWDLCAMEAAGAVLSTTNDLAKFALANFKPDSILTLQRKLTFTDGRDSAALGWFIKHYPDGREYVWHNGGTGGYSSSMAIDPNFTNAVILLSNISGKNDILDETCAKLMKHLLTKE